MLFIRIGSVVLEKKIEIVKNKQIDRQTTERVHLNRSLVPECQKSKIEVTN